MISLLHGTTMGCKRKSPAVVAKKEALKPKEINRKEAKPVSDSTVSKETALSSKKKPEGSSADKPKLMSQNGKKTKVVPKPIVKDNKKTKSTTGTPPLNEGKTDASATINPELSAVQDSEALKATPVSNTDASSSSQGTTDTSVTINPELSEALKKATPEYNPVAPVIPPPPYNEKLVGEGIPTTFKPPVPFPRSVDPVHGQLVASHQDPSPDVHFPNSVTNNGMQISNQDSLLPSAPCHQYPGGSANAPVVHVQTFSTNDEQPTTKPFHQHYGYSYGMQMPNQGFSQPSAPPENHNNQGLLPSYEESQKFTVSSNESVINNNVQVPTNQGPLSSLHAEGYDPVNTAQQTSSLYPKLNELDNTKGLFLEKKQYQ